MSGKQRPDDGTRSAALAVAAILAGLALGAAIALVVTWAREPRPAAPVWVSVRIAAGYPGWYFRSERIHRAYSTRAACERTLPLSGMKTTGRRTERVQWYCERVLGGAPR